ncbi:phospholipid scramblase 1-like isoform X2 [Lytechinus variegatus]|uniref:phospholipid scramblase 1-like isoform X2 n=1 Tax=Lytechinus variegatus TaxID=7654 RepID=UPI001BB2B253|nr:phospholipid scramblase 1-like isoform X2 [Lytechinus variegatus]
MAQPPPPPQMAMNPVGQQPGGKPPVNWMPAPTVAAPQGCPPGLEYLTQVDQLLVHQIVELFEMFTGVEMANRYAIKNSLGQQVYFAHEESDFCMRQCCGPQRGFIIHITDNSQQEVMRLEREFKFCAGCGWCAGPDSETCSFEVRVEAPVGNIIGYVRQAQYYLGPKFDILDAERKPVVRIKGPYCMCQDICCQGDIEFDVFTGDMASTIGKVSKQWPGCFKHAWTDADNFGVTFPVDLHVNVKATLLAAVFLIDFMFFEESNNGDSG